MDKIKVKAIIGVELSAPEITTGSTSDKNSLLRSHAETVIKSTLSDMNPEILRLNLSRREKDNGN